MRNYCLTVYKENGDILLDENLYAFSDDEAKNEAAIILKHKNYDQQTHRFVSPDAKLLLFHR